MLVFPVIRTAKNGRLRGKDAQSTNELRNNAKGPLSEAALFAIVRVVTKQKMVNPR